jgi:type I restriction enzyme S subunit
VTEQKANQLNVCNVVHNDVLIAKVGDPPCDAAPYLEAIRAVVTQDVIRIMPTTGVDTLFLSHLMNSSIGRDAVRQITIEGTRARVSLTELKALSLPKPPFLEQKIMGERLESLQARISREMESIDKLQAIKTGLMQDLLTGKVRVNVDETEETPA